MKRDSLRLQILLLNIPSVYAQTTEEYLYHGNICSDQKNYQKAILEYSKAIEINHKYAEAYYGRGIAFAMQGNLAKSFSDFFKGLSIRR